MNIPLKRGMLLRHQGHVYTVHDFQERHTGKQKPTVHVSLRDVRDGHPVDRTLADLEPIQELTHQYRNMQYLYAKGGGACVHGQRDFRGVRVGRGSVARERAVPERG